MYEFRNGRFILCSFGNAIYGTGTPPSAAAAESHTSSNLAFGSSFAFLGSAGASRAFWRLGILSSRKHRAEASVAQSAYVCIESSLRKLLPSTKHSYGLHDRIDATKTF